MDLHRIKTCDQVNTLQTSQQIKLFSTIIHQLNAKRTISVGSLWWNLSHHFCFVVQFSHFSCCLPGVNANYTIDQCLPLLHVDFNFKITFRYFVGLGCGAFEVGNSSFRGERYNVNFNLLYYFIRMKNVGGMSIIINDHY